MIRKFAYNRIFRTTGMLLLLLLLLIFPASKEYSLDDTTIKTSYSKKQREVYLIDKNNYVARCKLDISAYTQEEYAKKLIELIKIDGKYNDKLPNGFRGLLPSDLIVNNIKINDGNITIDFSNEFYDIKKEDEKKALELITYNMTSIEGISEVYINIDGKKLSKFESGTIVNMPLTKNDGVNIENDVYNYKDAKLLTVYYVNKAREGYYFIPVSKVTNDKRDNIKIIIDELKSTPTYQTGLMSFLNYNTELLDYNLNNDKITLNFNNYLYDDQIQKTISEEVIYTVALSMRDNYDVKEVIFNINGNEITKSVIKNIE